MQYAVLLCCLFFFLMIRRPPRSTQSRSSAASDVYKRQGEADARRRARDDGVFSYEHDAFPSDGVAAVDVQGLAGDVASLVGQQEELSLIHISEPTRPY